jgi:hypothetical protein
MRTTLSGLFVSGQKAGPGAAGSAAKPEGGGSEDRYKQGAGVASQATACPSPSIETVPARAAAGAEFRLRGHDFSSGCDRVTPAQGVTILFRQDGKTWKLTALDADRDLAFDTRLRVPKNAGPGRAIVLATTRSGERAKERFVALE